MIIRTLKRYGSYKPSRQGVSVLDAHGAPPRDGMRERGRDNEREEAENRRGRGRARGGRGSSIGRERFRAEGSTSHLGEKTNADGDAEKGTSASASPRLEATGDVRQDRSSSVMGLGLTTSSMERQ